MGEDLGGWMLAWLMQLDWGEEDLGEDREKGWEKEKDETYDMSEIVKDIERDEAEEVSGCDEDDGEEEMALYGLESLFRHNGRHAIMFDRLHLNRLPVLSRLSRSDLGCLTRTPASYPQRDSHDREISSDEHGAGEVSPHADEPIRLHEYVEEEALVEVFEQVV